MWTVMKVDGQYVEDLLPDKQPPKLTEKLEHALRFDSPRLAHIAAQKYLPENTPCDFHHIG